MDPTSIFIDGYLSPEGPRIMLFGTLQMNVCGLKNLFKSSHRTEELIYLEKLDYFVSTEISIRLSFVDLTNMSTAVIPTGLKTDSANSNSFHWTVSMDQSNRLEQLIDGFMEVDYPCHIYLTEYPIDDATLILSKGEYGVPTNGKI